MRTYRHTPRSFAFDLVQALFEATYLHRMREEGDATITDEECESALRAGVSAASRAAVFCGAHARRGYTRAATLLSDAGEAFASVSSGIECDFMGLFPEFFDATLERVERKIRERHQAMVDKLKINKDRFAW